MKKGLDYKAAGVDIDSANQSVNMIKKWVSSTKRSEVLSELGSFAGLFELDTKKYRQPVLVSGTDGVGTKLLIAQKMGIHDTVGIDLVAMCVNDILVCGAEPLFFLDYIALGKLRPDLVESIVKGVSSGCIQAGCALIGGETAEMPGMYAIDEYDLAGFAVGVAEKSDLITGADIKPGDVLIGLPSSGLHSNGFSLARKVFFDHVNYPLERFIDEFGMTLGEELMKPTKIYVKEILALMSSVPVKGMAHITGGGIEENLIRVLPESVGAEIEKRSLPKLPVFTMIQELGTIADNDMYKTFNMGIGFIVVVSSLYQDKAVECLRSQGEKPIIIGSINAESKGVQLK